MKTILGLAATALIVAVSGSQVAFKAEREPRSAKSVAYKTLEELSTILDEESEVVLVEFCVPSGCSRCDQMRMPIDRLAAEQRAWLKVRRVNLSEYLQLMVELKLTACPSYVAFRDGEEVFRTDSPTSADRIASGLDKALVDFAADQLAHRNP